MNRIVTYIILLLCSTGVRAQNGENFSTGRIELDGGRFVIESFTVKMVGDTVMVELGDLKVLNGDSPTVHRFSAPMIFAVPQVRTQTRQRIDPTQYAGVVTVDAVKLAEEDGELVMEMEVRTQREAMNRRQSWTIIPELRTPGDSTVTFAGMLINGTIKEKHYRRKLKFNNTALVSSMPQMKVSVTAYTDTLLRYNIRLPYEVWMDDATLSIHQVLTSPADKEQLFTVGNAGTVKLEPRIPYTVQPRLNYYIPGKENKQRRMEGQAYLDFQVGRSVLLPTYRRNPEELAKIDAIISTVLDDNDITLTGVTLTGYASPEGSYESNDRLSRARAEALKNYLRDKFRVPESLFSVGNVAEDWDGLRELLIESDLADKERVLDIIDNVGIMEGRESRLMQLNAGRQWRTMLTEMFPDLRRVEYRADFTIREYTLEEAKDIVGRKPENLSHYEMYILADSYEEGTPEKDRMMELMIRQYPDDRTAMINYAASLLSNQDLNGAKRYLDRVGDDPRAYNNLGVYWLLAGDLERAEEYFQQARETASAQAEHNLAETAKKREDNALMKRYEGR